MIIVDGEALGSILHSALTKTGKPKQAEIKKQAEAQEPAREAAQESESTPEPEPPAKAVPARATHHHKEGGSR